MDDRNLRNRIIRLAHAKPEFREKLLPLVTAAKKEPFKFPDRPDGVDWNAAYDASRHIPEALKLVKQSKSNFEAAQKHRRESTKSGLSKAKVDSAKDGYDRNMKWCLEAWTKAKDMVESDAKKTAASEKAAVGRPGTSRRPMKWDAPPAAADPAPGAKIPVGSQAIRSGYYKVTDGYWALEEAVKDTAATKDDKALQKAVADLNTAIEGVSRALKPYAWD